MYSFLKIQLSFFFLLIVFAAFGVRVEACLMGQGSEWPRAKVNPGVFILVGEVIGYTEPVTDPLKFRGSAVGVRLKPVESIHFPYPQNDYVEVFMFRHDPDCFPVARDKPPKLGSRLRVALYEARLVANRSGSHVRLESMIFSRIANDEAMFGFSTNVDSVFDYKRDFRALADKFAPPEMMEKRQWLDDFSYIETSKDLLRFQLATTEKARMDLLERLLYAPNIDFVRLLYSRIGSPPDWYHVTNGPLARMAKPTSVHDKKLSKRENELLKERIRLEATGELEISKGWITH